MDLKTACDRFKEAENNEVAALVVQDAALQRVLAVWPMVKRQEAPRMTSGLGAHSFGFPEDATLDDLWASVKFDEREVVDLAGLPSGAGLAAFRRARALCLVYPDGTIHKLAGGVLRKMIRDALGGKGPAK